MTLTVETALKTLPLVAILRGLRPEEAVDVGQALAGAGFTCLEVPLNSPEPLDSIRRLRGALVGLAAVGARTVLTPPAVPHVADAGGQLAISPNRAPPLPGPRHTFPRPCAPLPTPSRPWRG